MLATITPPRELLTNLLENQSESKFQLSSSLLRCIDSEVAAIDVGFRSEAIYVVEQVVRLDPDLCGEVFAENQILEQRGIHIFLSVTTEAVAR